MRPSSRASRAWAVIPLMALGGALVANPIFVKPHTASPADLGWEARAIMIAVALLVECQVVLGVLERQDRGAYPRILAAWILMHLVSYPITHYLSGFLGWRAELFPLAFEVWLFPQWARLTVRRTWKAVLLGNLASFALGIVLPPLWVRWFLPHELRY